MIPNLRQISVFVFVVVAVISCLFLAGCNKSSPVSSNDDNGNSGDIYTIETEPSLSPDRNYVYFVAVDTTVLDDDGIWRAKRSNPIREKVFLGKGFHSPTLAFDKRKIAYLKSGHINYYREADSSTWESDINQSFESIVYIGDNRLLGCRSNSIYIINEAEKQVKFLAQGWDPTHVSSGAFIFLNYGGNQFSTEFVVLKLQYPFESIDTVFNIVSLSQGQFPHWATMEPGNGRLSFTVRSGSENLVYAADPQNDSCWQIAASSFNKSLIVSYNTIIFTGVDGRFYQSNFSGTRIMPYWAALNPK